MEKDTRGVSAIKRSPNEILRENLQKTQLTLDMIRQTSDMLQDGRILSLLPLDRREKALDKLKNAMDVYERTVHCETIALKHAELQHLIAGKQNIKTLQYCLAQFPASSESMEEAPRTLVKIAS